MSAPTKQPSVSMSAVAAAGLASATAALLTSRFGVAGTIIGAALTTMIITGGSTLLSAYLQSVTGKVRRAPGKVRERASRTKEPEYPTGNNPPGRPDLRNNFMGRLRAALNWFSNLSTLRKRSIIGAALIPAVIAFLIGMGTITGVELASGKSLSCSVWSNCPIASATSDGTSNPTRPSLFGGGAKTDNTVTPQDQQQGVDPAQDQQQAADPAQNQQVPSDSGAQPSQPANPQENAAPDPADPETPAAPAPEDPETPAAPAPEDPAAQEQTPQEPAVEETPPEQQAPGEPQPSETPAPADPSGSDAQEPDSQP